MIRVAAVMERRWLSASRLRECFLVVATSAGVACGKTAEPSGLVGCEPVLDVAGLGENIVLRNETRRIYGRLRQNTAQGCALFLTGV